MHNVLMLDLIFTRALICGLLGFLGLSLCACASTVVVERFDSVHAGMSRVEVIELLGEPSSLWPLTLKDDGLEGERLQWGDGLSSLASGAAFHGEPERAYSVVFDAKGKVVRTAVPNWVADEEAQADAQRARRAARGDQ